ncbi:hypothetical protein P2H50_18750, partial [Cronobacter sakazakii]|nr:hypothetical protein [Cronobacter sakazakii]
RKIPLITHSRHRIVQKTVLAWDSFRIPSGPLEDALERFKPSSHVGLIEFVTEDCVRSELCKVVLDAYQ